MFERVHMRFLFFVQSLLWTTGKSDAMRSLQEDIDRMILHRAVVTFEDDVETFLKGIPGRGTSQMEERPPSTHFQSHDTSRWDTISTDLSKLAPQRATAVSPRTCAGAKPSFTSKQHDS
jgi:hypothetical protein